MAGEGEFPKTDSDYLYAKGLQKGTYGIFDTFEQETLSVNTTSSSQSYSEEKDSHIIKNIGSVACYINLDAAATTGDWKLNPSDFVILNGQATAIHAITASGTTTLRIIGQN